MTKTGTLEPQGEVHEAPPRVMLNRIKPAETDRITLATEQAQGFVQGQTNHVGIGADDLHDEGAGKPRHWVGTGFAAPLAGGKIGLDVFQRQPLETNARLNDALTERLPRGHQADRGMDAVGAAR